MNALVMKSRCLLLILGLACLLVVGCSGKKDGEGNGGDVANPTGEVSGTVTLSNGKPLPAGWIAFHGKDASETAMAPIDEGKFVAKGVPIGDSIRITVEVETIATEAAALDLQLHELQTRAMLMKQAGTGGALDKQIEATKERATILGKLLKAVKGVKIDRKYTQSDSTPLRQKVEAGIQKADFKLE